MLREASPIVAASAIAMPAMPKTMPGARRLVLGQPGQAEDEQQGRDDVGGLRGRLLAVIGAQPFENMLSMRRVTAKPPKMLMLASRIATNDSTGDRRCRRARSAAARRRR